MNAFTQISAEGETRARNLRLTETPTGCLLREACDGSGRDIFVELSLRFFGLVLILSAYGLWVLPGSLFTGDVLLMKLILSAAFAVLGTILSLIAHRGLQLETEINLPAREIRFSAVNIFGRVRVQNRLHMDDIDQIVLQKDADATRRAQLYCRMADGQGAVLLATGAPGEMAALHRRLKKDCQSPTERLEARMAKSEPLLLVAAE